MAQAYEVLSLLIPTGGWVVKGDTFEGIEFLECDPITKAQFEAGFAKVDAQKAKEQAEAEAAKATAQSKLEVLGLTANDLKALGL